MTVKKRFGLALSGGGFRAALFHLGVFAALAERDLLKDLEVISTVSGGSIIGAQYYLRLKQLLQSKADRLEKEGKKSSMVIGRQDYIDLVETLIGDFEALMKLNVRAMVYSSLLSNLQMIRADYSRSDKLAEVFDRHLFQRVEESRQASAIQMRDLRITPFGWNENPRSHQGMEHFHPDEHNDERGDKIPRLVLNATTLNSGHNWRFEATKMGEPALEGAVVEMIDKNIRLGSWKSYEEVPGDKGNVTLGHAVAASASVPGLMHPLSVSELYEDGTRVQLVDGGVNDNQGIQGLLDYDCTHLIVSDCSGRFKDDNDPSTDIPSVLSRASSILQDRLREEQLLRILDGAQEKAKEKVTVLYVNSRKYIPASKARQRRNSTVVTEGGGGTPRGKDEGKVLPEGMPPVDVQRMIVDIRTDLDSFSDVERHALMAHGHSLSMEGIWECKWTHEEWSAFEWPFLPIKALLAKPDPELRNHLSVGERNLCKLFFIAKYHAWLFTALLASLILLPLVNTYGLPGLWERVLGLLSFEVSVLQLIIAIATLVGLLRGRRILQWILRSPRAGRIPGLGDGAVLRFGLCFFMAAFAVLYRYSYDKVFLGMGSLERFKPKKKAAQ